jgi:hypothetical protein
MKRINIVIIVIIGLFSLIYFNTSSIDIKCKYKLRNKFSNIREIEISKKITYLSFLSNHNHINEYINEIKIICEKLAYFKPDHSEHYNEFEVISIDYH